MSSDSSLKKQWDAADQVVAAIADLDIEAQLRVLRAACILLGLPWPGDRR